ncbi:MULTISPECIES: AAA family ATPase [unclassified Pseudomonas]|uniref:AAA family ATPase n=1 Tax=unclassified Pseudomonas TaxID=196821 RepID=UPI003132A818
MITHLQLKNFTAFTELAIAFSPGINIVIGENGTGKTQLLKAVLALSAPEARAEQSDVQLARKLCRLYHPLSGQVGELRRAGIRGHALLSVTLASGQSISAKFNGSAEVVKVSDGVMCEAAPAIFIPTKEVLSLVRGLTAEQPDLLTIERIFDDGYLDLASQLVKEGANDLNAKVQLDPKFASIVPRLVNLIGGQYLLENGRFVFELGRYEEKDAATRSKVQQAQIYQDSTEWKFVPGSKHRLSSGMTAEGFRKIGILQRLLSNGSLNPGTSGPLLWDEPESNLNPKLMKDLVLALLELARNGQQVILATHDYVLLKWFDLLMDKGKGDHVVFHRLYRTEGEEKVQHESQSDYSIVGRSAISNTFAELYDEDVKRALGGD